MIRHSRSRAKIFIADAERTVHSVRMFNRIGHAQCSSLPVSSRPLFGFEIVDDGRTSALSWLLRFGMSARANR